MMEHPTVLTDGKIERSVIAQLTDALQAVLIAAENAPELNMCNYDHDQVADLNAAMIDIYQIARGALAPAAQAVP